MNAHYRVLFNYDFHYHLRKVSVVSQEKLPGHGKLGRLKKNCMRARLLDIYHVDFTLLNCLAYQFLDKFSLSRTTLPILKKVLSLPQVLMLISKKTVMMVRMEPAELDYKTATK